MMKSVEVIFRYCDKSTPFSRKPRPSSFDSKSEIVSKSLAGLVNAINYCNVCSDIKLTLVEDPISDVSLRKNIDKSLNNLRKNVIFEHNVLTNTGNSASITQALECAKNSKYDLIYLCEDDYLYYTDKFLDLMMDINITSEKIFKMPTCIHPVDYPDRYIQLQRHYILLGKDRHWRTIEHTTGTVMLPKEVIKDCWEDLYAFRNYGILPGHGEDETINKIYKKYICLSPIPSLAEHYQYKETLSPFCDMSKFI